MTSTQYAELSRIRLKLEDAFKTGDKDLINSLYNILLDKVDKYHAYGYDVADLNIEREEMFYEKN